MSRVLREPFKKLCHVCTKIILNHVGSHSSVSRMKLKVALMDEAKGTQYNWAKFIIKQWVECCKDVIPKDRFSFTFQSQVHYGNVLTSALSKIAEDNKVEFIDRSHPLENKTRPLLKKEDDVLIKDKEAADDADKNKGKITRATSVAAEKEAEKKRKVEEDKRRVEMTGTLPANKKSVQVEEVNEGDGSDEESLASLVKRRKRMTKSNTDLAVATSEKEELAANPSSVHDVVDVCISNVLKDLNAPAESEGFDSINKKNPMKETETTVETASRKELSETAHEIAVPQKDFAPTTSE